MPRFITTTINLAIIGVVILAFVAVGDAYLVPHSPFVGMGLLLAGGFGFLWARLSDSLLVVEGRRVYIGAFALAVMGLLIL